MITNQIFEHFRAKQTEIDAAIKLLKKNGYIIYKTKLEKEEV